MSIPTPLPDSSPFKGYHFLRACLKGLVLYLLFMMGYKMWEPVRTGSLPTLYNNVVSGHERILWGYQHDIQILLNDHVIQRATSDTWNIVVLGSSEMFGASSSPHDSIPASLEALGLHASDGRVVRVYNLAASSGDIWKDLIIAETLLQKGLPIDLIVLSTFSYTFEVEYPHPLVINNPEIARAVLEHNSLDPFLLNYVPDLGARTLWTDRAPLSAWWREQSQALLWTMTGLDEFEEGRVYTPLKASLGQNKNLPFTRDGFIGGFHRLVERYHVPLLVINAPRPYSSDMFAEWLQEQTKVENIPFLDCEFVFPDAGTFYDFIHMIPSHYSMYAHILAQHLSSPAMKGVSPQLPLQLPPDFVAPQETCAASIPR